MAARQGPDTTIQAYEVKFINGGKIGEPSNQAIHANKDFFL